MLLPSLVFGPQVEGTGVLKVRGQDDRLVPGLSGKLNTQVPGIEGDEDKVVVGRCQMLGGERIETVDRVPKSSSVPYVLPSQGRQARCRGGYVSASL